MTGYCLCTVGAPGYGCVGVSCANGGMGGKEIVGMCGRRGGGVQEAYIFAKTSASYFDAAYFVFPMMLS